MQEFEVSRRRLFWMLKKWSSYSVWALYAERFDEFVRQYEIAVSDWPKGEAPPEYNLRAAYEAQSCFAKGLSMLGRGDRSVWRNTEDAYLRLAAGAVFSATKAITSYEANKYDGGEHGFPLYPEWTPRLEQLRLLKEQSRPEGIALVAEAAPDYRDLQPIALVDGPDVDILWWLDQNRAGFGPTPRAGEVPPLPSNVIIGSGDRVPLNGVWELVLLGKAPGETDLLSYFVVGSVTPWCSDSLKGPGAALPGMWRLVWEDTRYQDGVIPDESEYLAEAIAEVYADKSAPAIHPTRAEANQPCPNTGYWYTPAKAHSRALFKRGEVMPDFPGSSYGATIWYWDMNQTSQ